MAKANARLKAKYHQEIRPALQKELGLNNLMAVPRLEKIVLNMGLGEATQNVKIMDPLVADLASIAGQKPVTTKAKKSIAAFKVREGMPIGAMVTLRGDICTSFSTAWSRWLCPASVTSRAYRPRASTDEATTRWACATS